jgi:hypothetical protein
MCAKVRKHTRGSAVTVAKLLILPGSEFYQCVLAALDPSPSLFTLHESLLRSFDLAVPSPPTYFPHLSLIYANLTPEQKAQIIADLKQDGDVIDLPEGGCEIVGEKGFTPSEVLLVRTGGPPPEWEILARVPLRGRSE